MRASNEVCGMQLIEALNEDIDRELRIADEHIARALSAKSLRKEAVRSHSCACAAAAMRHDAGRRSPAPRWCPTALYPERHAMLPRPAGSRFRSVSPLPATPQDGE